MNLWDINSLWHIQVIVTVRWSKSRALWFDELKLNCLNVFNSGSISYSSCLLNLFFGIMPALTSSHLLMSFAVKKDLDNLIGNTLSHQHPCDEEGQRIMKLNKPEWGQWSWLCFKMEFGPDNLHWSLPTYKIL